MSTCTINVSKNSLFQSLHRDFWFLIRNNMVADSKTEPFWESVVKETSSFHKKYPFVYTRDILLAILNELERNEQVFQKSYVKTGSPFFQLHNDYWKIVQRFINGVRNEQYFTELRKTCQGLYQKYPSQYTMDLILALLHEIERRNYAERKIEKLFA